MTPKDDRLISVIIPLFRNETTVEEMHRRIARELERLAIAHEVIFVDDGSDDASADAVREIARRDPAVRLVALQRNAGQQQAVLAGMRAARGRLLATLDADLQDPPEALGLLLSHIGDLVDVVFAGRRGEYESRGRLWASRLFKRMLGGLTNLPSDAGMFLIMKREVADEILRSAPTPFYLPTAVMRVTNRVMSVPVKRARRAEGTSQYTAFTRTRLGLGAAWGAVWWRLRKRFSIPLRNR